MTTLKTIEIAYLVADRDSLLTSLKEMVEAFQSPDVEGPIHQTGSAADKKRQALANAREAIANAKTLRHYS